MKMSEPKHNHNVIVVYSETLPSAVEVTPLGADERVEGMKVGQFGAKAHYDPKRLRRMLLDLESTVDSLQAVLSQYPPSTSPTLYARLSARFLARISARRYRENGNLKTYAFDLGVMDKKMYFFLVIEKVEVTVQRRTVKVAPLSSVENAPKEWFEGITPNLIRSFLPKARI